ERATPHRLRGGGRRDQLDRRARRGPRRGDRRPDGPVVRGHPRRPVQGDQGQRRLPPRARQGAEGEARPVIPMEDEKTPPTPDETRPPPPPPHSLPPPPPPAEAPPPPEGSEPAPPAEPGEPGEPAAKVKKEPKK